MTNGATHEGMPARPPPGQTTEKKAFGRIHPRPWLFGTLEPERMEFEQVMAGRQQLPFLPCLLQPAQQLVFALAGLDLPEHRLHDDLAPRVDGVPLATSAVLLNALPDIPAPHGRAEVPIHGERTAMRDIRRLVSTWDIEQRRV